MDYSVKGLVRQPRFLSILSILLTIISCCLFYYGYPVSATVCLICAILSINSLVSYFKRLDVKFDYIVSATMNGDFSYKFPLDNCSQHESEINRKLNLIVDYLEKLKDKTRNEERFIGEVINVVETGIIVADENGHVVQANRRAHQLLSLPVITEIKQIPTTLSGVNIKVNTVKIEDESMDILTLTDISHVTQTAEVDSWEKLNRVLTHEIMNSLTPVNSIIDSLGNCLKEDPELKDKTELIQQIEVIKSSNKTLMDFVRNFRKIAVIPDPVPHVIYLKPFLQKIITLAKAFEGGEDIAYKLVVFPPDTMLYTDDNLLKHVLVNIIKNGIEAGAHNIFIEAEIKEDESIEISISNDGAPVPEKLVTQIFTPFFTTKTKGSGIGLSLSRQIISRLGGTITLTPCQMTRFIITL